MVVVALVLVESPDAVRCGTIKKWFWGDMDKNNVIRTLTLDLLVYEWGGFGCLHHLLTQKWYRNAILG